jgi:autotransporter-associated beta strand protein
VQQGGALLIEGGSLANGSVNKGLGANAGQNGSAYGGGIFIQGNQAITLSGTAGQPLTISDVIADQFGNGGTGYVVIGQGLVQLQAANTYTGSTTIDNGATLALDASGAGGAGSIVFAGPFAALQVANAALSGNALSNPIANFSLDVQIDLTGLSYAAGASAFISNGTLSVTSNGQTDTLALTGIADGTPFQVTQDAATGSDVSLLCFCAGTRIATPSGEVPVERLAKGDLVTTLRGAACRIVWIGQGRVLATRGRRSAATPVIVKRHALADNVPHRDLRVTKGHSLYLDGVLIPVEFLVNHRSIQWDDRAQEVALYHIELASHDVLLADGAPAESYRDDGNRWLFQNANAGWALRPQASCAPVLTGGPLVDAAWRRLLDRAGPRSGVPLTDDPDLHLLVDGKRVDATSRQGNVFRFRLSNHPAAVCLRSRAAIPAELGLTRDARPLGVALRHIASWRGRRLRTVAADDAQLATGFHQFEPAEGFRWTDGAAVLPVALWDGADALELHVACAAQYPLFQDAA